MADVFLPGIASGQTHQCEEHQADGEHAVHAEHDGVVSSSVYGLKKWESSNTVD